MDTKLGHQVGRPAPQISPTSPIAGIILGKKAGKAGNQTKLPSKNEINTLRSTIQTLCQSSNPLGRCLEYVQVGCCVHYTIATALAVCTTLP